MKSLIKKLPYLLLIIAGSAASLFSSAWTARIPGRNPIVSSDILSPDEPASKARFTKFRLINEVNSAVC